MTEKTNSMRYMGGKHRHGRRFAAVIQQYNPRVYHEPFCGMYSVGQYVEATKRSAADVHPDLIMMLRAARDGWRGPDRVTEEEWRTSWKETEPSALRGFIGFGCSFGGKFFGCYARSQLTYHPVRGWEHDAMNWAAQTNRGLDKWQPRVQGVEFAIEDYKQYDGDADVMYCDPPYTNSAGYSQGTFDTDEFWQWVREQSKWRRVIVSEATAPSDFTQITTFKSSSMCAHNDSKHADFTERLFTYNASSIFTHQVPRR